MPYQTVTMRPMESPRPDRRAWPADGTLDHWSVPDDGWPLRRLRIGNGTRGRMLLLGGRGDMIEKYLEPAVHWAAAGWRVTTFDWRGQGGSGRLLPQHGIGHFEDFGRWIGDLGALIADWNADSDGPAVMVGHSMGGHLLLRALVEGVARPDAAVLIAPMLGLRSAPIPQWAGPSIARAICALGFGRCPAWKEMPNSALRRWRLTHDAERYADEVWWRTQTPEIAVGAPSWRWIAEAYRSMLATERSPRLSRMDVPTLVIGTTADRLVSPDAIVRVAGRLPDARLHMYGPEAAHEILREADGVRLDAFARIDAFLDEKAPMA